MIEVQHVIKHYGPVAAVSDVSFRVEKGQILGLLGPNGAGKTTTMRVLTGCVPPTGGTAKIAGFDVIDEPIEAKRRTGYLPETPPLYPDMTVREYLTFCARINGLRSSVRKGCIDEAMARTSIADMGDRHCGKLSKGYRQRVGLAQAILHNPDVLILDEPTAGLDPKQIIETRELIKALAGDHTIILSTHILPEVSQTCERVVIINRGKVVAEDTPENLTGRLQGSDTVRLRMDSGGADPEAALTATPGVASVSVGAPDKDGVLVEVQAQSGADIRRALANTVVTRGWGLLEMTRARLSLEEVFLELTTEEAEGSEASDTAAPQADMAATASAGEAAPGTGGEQGDD